MQVGTSSTSPSLGRQLTIWPVTGFRQPSTPATWRRAFIERVKAARVSAGITPKQVAEALSVPLDTYKRWEKRALLPHHLIVPFCQAVSCDPVFLLSGTPFNLGRALSSGLRPAKLS